MLDILSKCEADVVTLVSAYNIDAIRIRVR